MLHNIDAYQETVNPGYRLGAYGLYLIDAQVGIGLKVSWDRLAPDAEGWSDLIGNIEGTGVQGRSSLVDIQPIIRWDSALDGHPVNVFGQFGLGFHLKQSAVRSEDELLIIDRSRIGFSTGIAFGLVIGWTDELRIELFPAYQTTLPLKGGTDFYSFNIGLSFRL